MHVKNVSTETGQKPVQNQNTNFTVKIITLAAQEIFKPKEEEKPKEPDLFEAMENFLNEPYEENKEEKESSPIAKLCADLLIKGFFNYIKQGSQEK